MPVTRTNVPSDIEIAQAAEMRPIDEVAAAKEAEIMQV